MIKRSAALTNDVNNEATSR